MKRVFLGVLLLIWAATNGSAKTQNGDAPRVSKVEWAADGTVVMLAFEAGGLYIVDSVTQDVLLELSGDVTGPITDASLQPAGTVIATVDRVSTVTLWDRRDGSRIRSITGDIVPYRLDWSPDGHSVFTTSIDEMVMRDASGSSLFSIPGAPEEIPLVRFNHDGTLLALSFSAKIEVWDIVSRQMLARNLVGGLRQSIQWSRAGDTLLAAEINNTREGRSYNIVTIHPMTGEILHRYTGFPHTLLSASWSPDETQILATSIDGTAYLIDTASGAVTPVFAGDTPLYSADWSPYGGQIAIGGTSSSPGEASLSLAESLPVHIFVPDPSPARLQSIADLCGAPLAVDRRLDSAITSGDYAGLIAQVESLPAGTIPPACAADLIAVAEAIGAGAGAE